MKKKLLAMLLVGVMAFSLSACSKKGEEEGTTTTPTTAAPLVYYEKGGEFYKELKDYSKYVELGAYSGMDVKVTPANVTDKQLKEVIDSEIERGTTYKQIKEGTVKEDDTINLDYTGKLDGVAFQGGSATGYTYEVNTTFIDSLDDQLPGLEIGKTYDLDVTFPEDYKANPALAGKKTVFTVKVNYVNGDAIVPEWTDEYVKELTEGKYTTTKDYEEYIKTIVKDYNLQAQQSEYNQNTWKMILDNCKIVGYPEDQLKESTDDYFEHYSESFKKAAESAKISYEEYLKKNDFENEEALKEECKKQAQSELEYIMIGVEIAKKEQLAVTEELYDELVKAYAKNYGFTDTAKFEEEYGIDYIMESFVFEGVCSWLYDNNKLVESEDVRPTEAPTTEKAESETTTTAE